MASRIELGPAMTYRIALVLLYLTAAGWGTWCAFRPTLESHFQHLQSDPGDTVLNHYILEHSLRCLIDSDYPGQLWSPPFFHPGSWTLTYSENLFGTVPVYALLRCFFEPLLAYQLWMMLMLLLNFASMAWVMRQFGSEHVFAILGAYLFAFGLPYLTQIGHQQLLPRMFIPLAVYFGWQLCHEPTVRTLVKLLACWYLQLLCGIYLAWFLSFGLAMTFVCLALVDFGTLPRCWRAFRQRWLTVSIALAITAGLSALILIPYKIGNDGFRRHWGEIEFLLPRLASWFSGPPNSPWHDSLTPLTGEGHHERWLFIGFGFWMLLVLGLIGVRRAEPRQRRVILIFLSTSLVIGLLTTLWPGEVTAWRTIYEYVPGARAIRAVGRIFIVVYVLMLIGVLLGTQATLARIGSERLRGTLSVGLLVMCVGEQSVWRPYSYPAEQTYARIAPLAERMREAEADAVLVIAEPEQFWIFEELIVMWAGMQANVPVVNGYTGRYTVHRPETITDDEALITWLRQHHWTGRVAVIGPGETIRYREVSAHSDHPPARDE